MKTRIRWGTFAGIALAGSAVLSLLLFTLIRTNTPSKNIAIQPPLTPAAAANWKSGYAQLPIAFEENRGQAAQEVKFVAHGAGYGLALTPQEADITLLRRKAISASPLHRAASLRELRAASKAHQTTAIRMQLDGANPLAKVAGADKLPGRTNYFRR